MFLFTFPDNLRKIAGARSKLDRPCVHLANFQRERETDGGKVERREKQKSQRGEKKIIDSEEEEEIEESERARETTDRCSRRAGTYLGEQVVHVAQAAAFFIERNEVASPPTAQWGPRKHHLRDGRPEG